MARRIQLRRDTAANWSSTNPVLAQGEIGIDLTNNKLKIGNGTAAWNSLSYWDDKEPNGFDGTYDSLTGKPVLFSGSYNDLTDTPTIPSSISDFTDIDGTLSLPGAIRQNNSWTRVTNSSITFDLLGTVVWTSTVDDISSAKLVIQVECDEVGDATGWHSQACEAIIACRGYANTFGGPGGDPQMIVYGVVHTSVDPLVTFTVQRNPTTKMVEVVGTLTAAAGTAAALKIHSVEMLTRD